MWLDDGSTSGNDAPVDMPPTADALEMPSRAGCKVDGTHDEHADGNIDSTGRLIYDDAERLVKSTSRGPVTRSKPSTNINMRSQPAESCGATIPAAEMVS